MTIKSIYHEGVHLDRRCGQRYVFQPFAQTLALRCTIRVFTVRQEPNLHLEFPSPRCH